MSNTKIDAAKVQALVEKHPDLKCTAQSAFVRIEHPNGLRVYASKSAYVTRVDISGFTYPSGPGIIDLPPEKRPTGKVCQQVDFSGSEEAILETIDGVLEYMCQQPKKESAKRQPAEGKEAPKGWSFGATTQPEQPQA